MAMHASTSEDSDGQFWQDLVENSVECELCNEPYDDEDTHVPRLLTCGHTFCQQCLEDWSTTPHHTRADVGDLAVMDCPTCRNRTSYDGAAGARSLPKNYELLRVRQEIKSYSQSQLNHLKARWNTRVSEKEEMARKAQMQALKAQEESEAAAERAATLAEQVQLNEQEKKSAQDMAEEARQRALQASKQAEALQSETDQLKEQLRQEATQLARVQSDASTAAQAAKEMNARAEMLQQQVDKVSAQLSLHSGRHDPSKLVVLVCEPTTVGSWLLPYTRYTVISCASDSAQPLDAYEAAKTWTKTRELAEKSSSVRVYRRYSDFVWLHRQLRRRFPFELVPKLPGKQLFFNKDKEFVGERMRLLQAFVRDVLRQSSLASAQDVRSFLLSTTEELEQIRKASSMVGDEVEQGDQSWMEEEATWDELEPTMEENSSNLSTSPALSSWANWDNVSKWTSTAVSFVSSTGSKLSQNLQKKERKQKEDRGEMELSRSLVLPHEEGYDPSLMDGKKKNVQRVELRRQYIDIGQKYEDASQKGGHLARLERQRSRHLHRVSELLHAMDTLDQDALRKTKERLAASTDGRMGQDDDLRFEARTFDARASDTFSAFSLGAKNHADCGEYALLEVMRMQTLELGAIEDAFTRIRKREEALTKASHASSKAGSQAAANETLGSWQATAQRKTELRRHREDVMDKVEAMDPKRAAFVAQTLARGAMEMVTLAKERRELFEDSYKQLKWKR